MNEELRRTLVKVCCIASIEEAFVAIDHGAYALGFVSDMPSGPGVIPEKLIAEIINELPPGVRSFLLTSKRDAGEVVSQLRRCGANTIQLCDRLRSGTFSDLRSAIQDVSIVQVLHVDGPQTLLDAQNVAPDVDAILLDSGRTTSSIKELGGTGRTHDWSISRAVSDAVSIPVFLAGGLTADNVAEAVCTVRPRGVDVCTGVRTDGDLDEEKLFAFFAALASV